MIKFLIQQLKIKTDTLDYYADGVEYTLSGRVANNVIGDELTIKLVDEKGKAVKGQTVTFDTNSSNITLNKEKLLLTALVK